MIGYQPPFVLLHTPPAATPRAATSYDLHAIITIHAASCRRISTTSFITTTCIWTAAYAHIHTQLSITHFYASFSITHSLTSRPTSLMHLRATFDARHQTRKGGLVSKNLTLSTSHTDAYARFLHPLLYIRLCFPTRNCTRSRLSIPPSRPHILTSFCKRAAFCVTLKNEGVLLRCRLSHAL